MFRGVYLIGELIEELKLAGYMSKILNQAIIEVRSPETGVKIEVYWESDYEGSGPTYEVYTERKGDTLYGYGSPYMDRIVAEVDQRVGRSLTSWKAGGERDRQKFINEVTLLNALCENL